MLRVCADPDYLPFSNRAGDGFENAVAQAIARHLGKAVDYTWWSYRGNGGFEEFLARTLNAGRCDLVMNLPYGSGEAFTTEIGAFLPDYPELRVVPVPNERVLGTPERYSFPMSMAVRSDDQILAERLDAVALRPKILRGPIRTCRHAGRPSSAWTSYWPHDGAPEASPR